LSLAGSLEETLSGSAFDVDELMEMENVREIVRIITASFPRKSKVTASTEWNFAGRLVERLGPGSCLIDAATGRTICPEGFAAADCGVWRLLDFCWFEGGAIEC
jgi:hypothetical protein